MSRYRRCTRCRRLRHVPPGRLTCTPCRRAIALYGARRYEELALRGLCVACKKPAGATRCPDCLARNRESTRACRARKETA